MRAGLITFLVFGLVLSLSSSYALTSEIEVDSRITQVMVYPDSALINRTATLGTEQGEHKAIFPNIIPDVDENSLRVSAGGNAEARIFGARLKREYLEEVPSEGIRGLKEQIQRLEDETRQLQNLKNLLSEEKDFLDSIRLFSKDQIPKDLVTRMPSPEELDKTLKFLVAGLKENYSAVMDCELKIRNIKSKVDALKRELSEISGSARKLRRSIVVDLEVLKPGTLDLNVSYLVRGAFWQPIYDARADLEGTKVELVSYGIVKQTTGEDWSDVEISLSTARPAIGGRMPDISPWFLRPYPPAFGAVRKGAMMAAEAPAEKKELRERESPGDEEDYVRVEEKGTAVIYKLLHKAGIKADGSEHKLPIASQALKADFGYSTYPRVTPFAYLNTLVTNAQDLQLLAGRVNIFLGGDYVGSSTIDTIGPGEEFDLYLGVDENVKVKREQIEKKVDETLIGGIPSKTRSTTFKYKLTVENYKPRKIKVNLFEAMPVSEDDRIKVKIHQANLEPKEKEWKDKKGIWRWELKLEPREKKEIFYSYTVEHPRDMRIEGL